VAAAAAQAMWVVVLLLGLQLAALVELVDLLVFQEHQPIMPAVAVAVEQVNRQAGSVVAVVVAQ
jgi:hypothetical protein